MRLLRALKLDAVLLAVVALVGAATVVVTVVRWGFVRRSGLALVLVVVVGLRVVGSGVVALRSAAGSPAGAVEGIVACATAATRGETAAEDEEEEEADDDYGQDDPADPVAPGGVVAVLLAIAAIGATHWEIMLAGGSLK